ncbi:patatin-like phospholipase family protein [Chitinophaga sp. 30R24]|uniref:patatin-like phospholipase family protein n=1 Tax=Chitinophaga sp. 30R24 TaxID=3248838 RepID=UPI003B8F5129
MPPKQTLHPDDFTKDPRVQKVLERLKQHFDPEKNPLVVSDVLDETGQLQFVNLVQKGGGVLGIALVGYTYILEEMGIRFLKLAGTSAGAINTALLTVIGKKEDKKTDDVLKILCPLDFFSFVDGHPAARWLIKKIITKKDFVTKATNWLLGFLGICLLLAIADILLLGLSTKFHAYSGWAGGCFILSGFVSLIGGLSLAYVINLLRRLKNSGFGINPGNTFYDWIKTVMDTNGVQTVSQLKAQAAKCPPLKLRVDNDYKLTDLKGEVAFIASELVTQNKIQFPEMTDLFTPHVDSLHPAGFVRASMSIPVFFESYLINNIPVKDPAILTAWENHFGNDTDIKPAPSARFVDGGILSNFPISIFYNPNVTITRIPTFGIDLDDSKPADKQQQNPFAWSLTGYLGRMFNTIRNYYDKDFLIKNEIYRKGIGKVDLSSDQFNWLNFFLTNNDKIDMFALGAEAAEQFLMQFKWDSYKNERTNWQKSIKNIPPEL